MKQNHVAVIGACLSGGVHAGTAHRNPLFKNRYMAETSEIRLKQMTEKVRPLINPLG